jgi:hypothetical protein
MDYSTDSCYQGFTQLQKERMHYMYNLYRDGNWKGKQRMALGPQLMYLMIIRVFWFSVSETYGWLG